MAPGEGGTKVTYEQFYPRVYWGPCSAPGDVDVDDDLFINRGSFQQESKFKKN